MTDHAKYIAGFDKHVKDGAAQVSKLKIIENAGVTLAAITELNKNYAVEPAPLQTDFDRLIEDVIMEYGGGERSFEKAAAIAW